MKKKAAWKLATDKFMAHFNVCLACAKKFNRCPVGRKLGGEAERLFRNALAHRKNDFGTRPVKPGNNKKQEINQ